MKTTTKILDWRISAILMCIFLFLTSVVQGQTVNSIEEVRSKSKASDQLKYFEQLAFSNATTYFMTAQNEKKDGVGIIKVIDLDLNPEFGTISWEGGDSDWNFEKVQLVVIRNVNLTNLQKVKEDLLDKLPDLKYVYLILGKGDLGNWLTRISGTADNPWHYVYTRQVDSE